jgi:hypothetical protein
MTDGGLPVAEAYGGGDEYGASDVPRARDGDDGSEDSDGVEYDSQTRDGAPKWLAKRSRWRTFQLYAIFVGMALC